MSDWLEKFKKKLADVPNYPAPPMVDTTPSLWVGAATSIAAPSSAPPYNITNSHKTGTVTGIGSGFVGSFNYTPPSYVVQFNNNNSQEIVRLNNDGTVQWNKGIEIDEAAEAFSKSLTLGAEMHIGISKRVKQNMRDSVFEDLISIAKEKGSLSAEDLTYLLEASKIIEKLKGGKNDS